MFSVKDFHHGFLIDSHHRTIGHCGCRAHAKKLPSKAPFSEEITLVQNADCRFLSRLRHNRELYLSFQYVENSIGRVALSEDRLFFRERRDLPTTVNCREKCLGIKFLENLGCYGCYGRPLFESSECAEVNFV